MTPRSKSDGIMNRVPGHAWLRGVSWFHASHHLNAQRRVRIWPLVPHIMAMRNAASRPDVRGSQVAREQRAFTNLIEFKSHVVVPLDSGPGSQVSRGLWNRTVQAMTHPPTHPPTVLTRPACLQAVDVNGGPAHRRRRREGGGRVSIRCIVRRCLLHQG